MRRHLQICTRDAWASSCAITLNKCSTVVPQISHICCTCEQCIPTQSWRLSISVTILTAYFNITFSPCSILKLWRKICFFGCSSNFVLDDTSKSRPVVITTPPGCFGFHNVRTAEGQRQPEATESVEQMPLLKDAFVGSLSLLTLWSGEEQMLLMFQLRLLWLERCHQVVVVF